MFKRVGCLMSNTKCSLFGFKPIIMSSHCAQLVSKVSLSVLNEFVSVSVNLIYYVVLISFKNRQRTGDDGGSRLR